MGHIDVFRKGDVVSELSQSAVWKPKLLNYKGFIKIWPTDGQGADPVNSASFSTTSPTRLSGVDAPDVRPMEIGPLGGNQGEVVSSVFAPTGRCRISPGDTRQSGSAM